MRQLSEANARLNGGGTAGPLARRVDDSPAGVWADIVETDDLVRCGTNHTHARSNQATLGEPISAPASADGGTIADVAGDLVGYTPLGDWATVDVAARTASESESGPSTYIDAVESTGVHRGPQHELLGAEVYKAGSRTGVTSGRIIAADATVTIVDMQVGETVLLDDVLLATLPVGGNDSGSAVYTDGQLVGMVSSALDDLAIICHAGQIEAELGVELLPK